MGNVSIRYNSSQRHFNRLMEPLPHEKIYHNISRHLKVKVVCTFMILGEFQLIQITEQCAFEISMQTAEHGTVTRTIDIILKVIQHDRKRDETSHLISRPARLIDSCMGLWFLNVSKCCTSIMYRMKMARGVSAFSFHWTKYAVICIRRSNVREVHWLIFSIKSTLSDRVHHLTGVRGRNVACNEAIA